MKSINAYEDLAGNIHCDKKSAVVGDLKHILNSSTIQDHDLYLIADKANDVIGTLKQLYKEDHQPVVPPKIPPFKIKPSYAGPDTSCDARPLPKEKD